MKGSQMLQETPLTCPLSRLPVAQEWRDERENMNVSNVEDDLNCEHNYIIQWREYYSQRNEDGNFKRIKFKISSFQEKEDPDAYL